LIDTLNALEQMRIETAGAGCNLAQASTPAILETAHEGRLLVFSFACVTSGTPRNWAATPDRAGVNLLPDLSEATVTAITQQIQEARRPNDIVIVSVHWGPNWGYEIEKSQRRFARELIDQAGISILHGHSSHHAKAIEVYKSRLILYGCGDFLNDYEGIRGYEEFRDDLPLMYFASVDPTDGDLVGLELVPLSIRRFQLTRASRDDADWLCQTLDRESRRFGARVEPTPRGRFALSWSNTVASARPMPRL